MRPQLPEISLAGTALLLLLSCQRETRDIGEMVPTRIDAHRMALAEASGFRPQPDRRIDWFESNAYEIGQGQQLYDQFNCSTCHANGGGDIGPALMDSAWTYGGRIDQIAASIRDGRPNGMPAFRDTLTEQQIWQIAGYVRSMSGNVARDAASSRGDTMANTEPLTRIRQEPVTVAGRVDRSATR